MVDWVTLAIATVLFIVLSPGLLLQIPGDERPVDFRNWQTSLASVLTHAVVFFLLLLLVQALFHAGGHSSSHGPHHMD
eukprot:jgi/Mesen1/1377/ME000013S00857